MSDFILILLLAALVLLGELLWRVDLLVLSSLTVEYSRKSVNTNKGTSKFLVNL